MEPQKSNFAVSELPDVDRYKLMTGLVTPRPIGWIGTRSPDGVANVAPYSFFNGVSSMPPVVYFSAATVGGTRKDSLVNAEASGEFTVNIVSFSTVEAMNQSAANLPADQSEFDAAGLTVRPSVLVEAPGVAEAKAILECRVVGTHAFGTEEAGYVMVLGEVVHFSVDDDVLDGTRIRPEALDSIGRLAGTNYVRTTERFSLERPA